MAKLHKKLEVLRLLAVKGKAGKRELDEAYQSLLSVINNLPVSSAVVLCFRTQIFITRSDVVLVSGIQRGEPEIVGRYDSLGNPLGA